MYLNINSIINEIGTQSWRLKEKTGPLKKKVFSQGKSKMSDA